MLQKSAHEEWLSNEGVPVYGGYHVEDVSAVALGEWQRFGGRGAIFNLRGMDGFTLSFVVEVAPHATLNRVRHMYEELLYVHRGQGTMTLFGRDGEKVTEIPWRKGTLMAPPLNCPYELENTGDDPALLVGVTDLALMMDLFYDEAFIFGSDVWFEDRVDAVRTAQQRGLQTHVNARGSLVMDAAKIDDVDTPVENVRGSHSSEAQHGTFAIAGNVLTGHLAQEPVGRYDPAHYHGGGANILILRSHGYSLMWPAELGPRPYEAGYGDRIVRVDWRPGSIICPPGAWFHQHFNLGDEPARNIACRFGYGLSRPTKFYLGNQDVGGRTACTVSFTVGGTLVPFEEEDPEIHRQYEAALEAEGQQCTLDHSLLAMAR